MKNANYKWQEDVESGIYSFYDEEACKELLYIIKLQGEDYKLLSGYGPNGAGPSKIISANTLAEAKVKAVAFYTRYVSEVVNEHMKALKSEIKDVSLLASYLDSQCDSNAEENKSLKIETPAGTLVVEAKGSFDDYPGIYVYLEDGEAKEIVACVECCTTSKEILTETYCSQNDEPINIVQYSDGTDRSK